MKEALYILGSVIHHLQRERGCTALFLGSEGTLFHDQIEAQFITTDRELESLKESITRWQATQALKSLQFTEILAFLKKMETHTAMRGNILQQTRTAPQSIDYYSHQLICPLLQCMVEIALYDENNDSTCVSAYHNFLQWKERVGLERAIGMRGFLGHSFHNQEFLERIQFLLSEQENCRNTFIALANTAQHKLLQQSFLSSPPFQKLNEIHTALREAPESEILENLTPEAWFELISKKIDALHECEKKLIDTLGKKAAPTPIPEPSIEPVKPLGKYHNLIHSLHLFSGLSDKNLNQLLRYGQIRDFQKGKLLFLEGEQANRLYIILSGWVKVFKGTAAGDETILQMLSSGDSILESAVFLNTPFPVSAQVAEDAVLLSLPAPMIREQIRNDNDLALNLLTSMSYRSQNLIRQIEDARLKSADERIGWFLLKLLLEQGKDSRHVKLPYDKSLIASYLDMKRETFSRALKRMKGKGFKIENDTVIMPDLAALCGFCDQNTAVDCSLHNTPECSNPECTSTEI